MLAGVVAVGFVVFGIFQILSSGSLMQQAAADLQSVSRSISDGRPDVADRNLELARDHASSAKSRADGPVVWLGKKLPFVGDDVEAVQTAAEVIDSLANESLPKLVEASRSLSPQTLRPRKGSVSLEPIAKLQDLLIDVADDVDAAHDRVADVDVARLVGRLQAPMLNLQRQLAGAAALARRGATVVQLMPAMLGSEGPRTYALITQNNAEIRSTGGITGAVAIIRASHGKVRILSQSNELEFGTWQSPVVPLTHDEQALFGDLLARFPQNATTTPDFPRSAEILREMWRKKQGQDLDGVVSIDPVAMAGVLAGLGTVRVPDGRPLDAAALVPSLENTIYLVQPDYLLQDSYFAMVGKSIFDAAVSGRGDPSVLLDAVTTAVEGRRILLWSAHPEEQAMLAGTRISGDMPSEATGNPQLGMFLNDAASDKMSFYLNYRVDVQPQLCNYDGSQTLDVTLTMQSLAPLNIEEFGARLVFMGGYAGAPKLGTVRTVAHFYAPFGGRVLESTLDGGEAPVSMLQHLGREVTSITLDLAPQQTRVVTYAVRTGKDQPGPVELRTTPAGLGSGMGTVGPSACSQPLP
ncbi:MAG TPA: DUF4012 domain-containing protein [Nocardioidaceae bacterium]|nr:DUF4012 domain-containing protein [Nocardioidaceae bacterium]